MTLEPAVPAASSPADAASAATPANARPHAHELAPGVPIQFTDPRLALLTWERDAVHMPAALTPLACDYALVLGNSLNQQYPMGIGGFPHRWYTAIWHGYVYFALDRNASDEEWAALQARMDALCWDRALVTESYWNDEVIPELRAIYARMDSIEADHGSGTAVADAWESAWRDAERVWELHMDVTPGVYRARAEVARLYGDAVPGATRGEAERLLRGSDDELVEMDLATDALAALAAATVAVREALRSGERSLGALEALEGGPRFVAAVHAALAVHGHVGQLADDLAMPSFGEEPELFVAEVAKRLDGPPFGPEERRRQLVRDADELADRARSALSSSPDARARFDSVLAVARAIGPISERHNYWMDRAALAHLRRVAMRVGARLVREGVIDHASDILFLRRAEVGELLREPRARQAVVEARRAEHEADRRISPVSRVGGIEGIADDRPQPATPEPPGDLGLRGMGASPGIARGRARVVLDVNGFARVEHGDIIVCHASNSSFVPILSIAGGLIAQVGGILSHGAVVAREFGVPAVVGVANATTRIPDGQELEIDGTTGAIEVL